MASRAASLCRRSSLRSTTRHSVSRCSLAADAAPQFANAAFGDAAHAAVAIDQRPAEHGVRRVVAQQAQGEDGRAARGVVAHGDQAFQRAARVPAGDALDEQPAILIRQVAIVINDQNRGANATGVHAMTPLHAQRSQLSDETTTATRLPQANNATRSSLSVDRPGRRRRPADAPPTNQPGAIRLIRLKNRMQNEK